MLKVDWLSFTFKPTEEDIATYKDLLSAFLHYFPEFENIMSECVLFGSGKGRYFDNCLAWNDNILISFDNEKTTQDCMGLKAWEHGLNVCIPSHGLVNIFQMLSLPLPKGDYIYDEYKQIYSILLNRHCQISRLDLAFDDFSKTFTPKDFLSAWLNDEVQSPCRHFKWCEAGKGGGQTFYLGARANKMLRVYDKSKESKGAIDSIRYEVELHNKYAKDVSDMILSDNFDFFQYIQKYFVIMKKQKDGYTHVEKKYNSRLDNLELWDSFVSANADLTNKCIFPKTAKAVTMENKITWLKRSVLPSIIQYIKLIGYSEFLSLLSGVSLTPQNQKIVDDALRIFVDDTRFKTNLKPFARSDIMAMCAKNIEDAFI